MFSLITADKKGRIFHIPEFEAAGMKAGCFFRLDREDFIKMPEGSKLFMLPDRMPLGYNSLKGKFEALEGYLAVAAFITPAFTGAYSAAYLRGGHDILPLFCYTAAGFYKGDIYVAAIRVDRSFRHDPRFIDIDSVARNARKIKKLFQRNRLIRHLADCALIHGCPGAQNFFLRREECPLPVSSRCNASCAGCISRQKSKDIPATQPRIKFTPSSEEVAETALFYICNVKNTVGGGRGRPLLSFGQGCEGEPLLEVRLIEESIRLIRNETKGATINMNTNASRPEAIAKLFDAGLDSIRVSFNSVREVYYNRYYTPGDYRFKDVLESIKIAKRENGFVSINYLTMPGFTDSEDEARALKKFIEAYKIDMIQWRNLNFDPLDYFKIIKCSVRPSDMIGVRQLIADLKKHFPSLKMGYYNPSL